MQIASKRISISNSCVPHGDFVDAQIGNGFGCIKRDKTVGLPSLCPADRNFEKAGALRIAEDGNLTNESSPRYANRLEEG